MDAKKNIFGQYVSYTSPSLTDEEVVVVDTILNSIADSIQEQLEMSEFIKEVSNFQPTLQYIVGVVNAKLPDGYTKVDGASITSSLRRIINERIAGYYATVTASISGNGSVSGTGTYTKGDEVELTVIGDILSCSETVTDGTITISDIQEDIVIEIEFEETEDVEEVEEELIL